MPTVLTLNARGAEVKDLQASLKDKLGLYVPQNELDEQVFGLGTRSAVLSLQDKHGLERTGILDDITRSALERAVAEAGVKPRVEGRVVLEHGVPAKALTLTVYNRGTDGATTKLGEVTTDEQGFYALSYESDKPANIEVRARIGDREERLSDTRFNANKYEVLSLVAPSSLQPLAAEHTRLAAAVKTQLGGLDRLAHVEENGERRDLSGLHEATGWDGRVLALSAMASKLAVELRESGTALDPELRDNPDLTHSIVYALARAGLPTDKQQLALVGDTAVEKALTKANEAGIVSLTTAQIGKAKAAIHEFSRTIRLDAAAPGSLSRVGQLLQKSGLNDDEQKRFADLYFAHRGTTGELWKEAGKQGLPVERLQLQGKLAYLTHNNADLAATLQQQIESTADLGKLASKGFYREKPWEDLLNAPGTSEADLVNRIPPAYRGATATEGLRSYAADLARKVRISFPNQVVARMLENKELLLAEGHAPENVVAFLKKAAPLGFELGRMPVDPFVAENKAGLFPDGSSNEAIEATKNSVKLLQRLYQISPSDGALAVLLKEGFKSAHDIVALPYERFAERFGKLFPTEDEARLVYRKAQQVAAVTFNFFTGVKALESSPGIDVISGTVTQRQEARAKLKSSLKDYPTMESLFGSLDFCECEHCRSVLSPAAYFVDLLQFLEPSDRDWKGTLDEWKDKHDQAPYPFKDRSDWEAFRASHPGENEADTQRKPYAFLEERRPDLPHLALTCENTNTVLPYIDVVNEILEYSVANPDLSLPAHDTGDATTPELLAEPQNLEAKAYHVLREAKYPLTLPFDLWLETVHSFLDHFETPLWQTLEVFRQSDELFAPAVDAKPYYRAAIFAEYLGVSPAEYALLTDANALARWHEMYGYGSEADALAALRSAKTLSRRLGVSYREITDIVQTTFVNPALGQLAILWKLRLGVGDVVDYFTKRGKPEYAREQEALEERFKELDKEYETARLDSKVKLAELWDGGVFKQALLLRDSSGASDFDQTYLELADGKNADAAAFLRLNLFVRLWRRLGWTIEETDRALQAFLPKDAPLGDGLKTALVYLAHLKWLNERLEVARNGLLKLPTLWQDLSTTGRNPLYAQLFLTRSVLKVAPIFDDPLGNYLSQPNLFVRDHLLALQGALNLTADDIGRILVDANRASDPERLADPEKAIAAATLSLGTASLLYRYALLAKALKRSVRDLITLKELSGLDPFKSPLPGRLTKIDDDHPFNHTVRFVKTAQRIAESGFSIDDLDYLFRHRFDPVGKYRPNLNAYLELVRTLAAGIERIRTEHSVPADASAITDDLLRDKLLLVFPPEVIETFLGLWADSIEFAERKEDVPPEQRLDPVKYEVDGLRVAYDDTRRRQSLAHRGVLTAERKAEILRKIKDPAPLFTALLDAIAGKSTADPKAFFDKYFEGFLTCDDLYGEGAARVSQEKKRQNALGAVVPYLRNVLTRRLIAQALTADLSGDPGLTEALLTDASLLADPNQPVPAGGKAVPLLNAFSVPEPRGVSGVVVKGIAERGVTAAFFASPDLSGPVPPAVTVPSTDLTKAPAGTNSARFEGYFEVPTTGAYRFSAHPEKSGARVDFRLAKVRAPIIRQTADQPDDELSAFAELRAGVLYELTLEAHNLQGGRFSLLVKGETTPKDALSQLILVPKGAVDGALRAYVMLSKTLHLARGLGLNEREVRHLLTHAADFGNLDLSKLPTRVSDGSPETGTALFQQFRRLLDYANLKRDLAGGSDEIIDILEAADSETARERLAVIARRPNEVVLRTAEELPLTATWFHNGVELIRLWEALRIQERLGVPVAKVAGAARIIGAQLTPDERFEIARELKNTVKARYETESWQRIAQTLFDKLRRRQRDALVAYIMQRQGFERIEQLFEYFLIDPGMEPVVQTSRLRLAISSVQLFIQRCLLNLEPRVHPSVINSRQWQWIKRYRIWEANRKIFLFPENWLEPEFRDDKTHLFRELESALLQGDVSNDLAEDALCAYLQKLEELARLDIVAMYAEERSDPDSNTLHVIGRTFAAPQKYFYRRYEHQMWTPWEPVATDIEGDHIIAIVWRERLHLFWVTFMTKPSTHGNDGRKLEDMAAETPGDLKPRLLVEAQLSWSEYFQGQWTPRRSGAFGPPLCTVADSFDTKEVFIHASKETSAEGRDGAVNIHLRFPDAREVPKKATGSVLDARYIDPTLWRHSWMGEALRTTRDSSPPPLKRAFRLAGKNALPEIHAGELPESVQYSSSDFAVTKRAGEGELTVSFVENVTVEEGKESPNPKPTPKTILQRQGGFTLLPGNPLRFFSPDVEGLVRPFFYQDDESTFFVEPNLFESTLEEWEEWAIPPALPDARVEQDDWWDQLDLKAAVSAAELPTAFDPDVLGVVTQPPTDWITDPATVLRFGDRLIGRNGALDMRVVSTAAELPHAGTPIDVNPGSEIHRGAEIVVAADGGRTDRATVLPATRINVIGGGGLNMLTRTRVNVGRARITR